MAQCRECKKAIKWIQVFANGKMKWQACDKTKPLTKHDCKEKSAPPKYSRQLDEPWWMK